MSWPMWSLRGINKAAWGAKLSLIIDLAFPVIFASLGHLYVATDGTALLLCLNACFRLFTAPHLPSPPTPPLPTL